MLWNVILDVKHLGYTWKCGWNQTSTGEGICANSQILPKITRKDPQILT